MLFTNKEQKSPAQRFLFILGLLMFGFYLVLGIFLIFYDKFPLDMEKKYRVAFGLLIIAYSFFRFIRLLKVRKD